jgi:class 3 adenylate cyclase
MAEGRTQRRLAAILAADVVSYSRLMEADEAGTLATLKARRKEVLQPLVAQHQGRVFKVTGDGVLVEFASAVNAVQCAVDLQQGMAGANDGQPEERHIVLRIGVNLGDVMVEGSDLYGEGVNIAARLQALAPPGGIYVSAKVRDEVGRKLATQFDDLGERELKNVAVPSRIYRVSNTPRAEPPDSLVLPVKTSIAVLPFDNLSGDSEQQYLSDGIAEDIITGLGRFHTLFVIDRHSSVAVSRQTSDLAEIGRRLGVAYLVQGSLQWLGKRVRVTVRLVDAANRAQLWGDAYDIPLSEILAISDKVIGAIISTLHERVESALLEQSRRKPVLAAYECVLRGIKHLRGYGSDDNRRALEYFQQAMKLDPEYALARAYHALAEVVSHDYEAPNAALAEALSLASTAVDLDEQDSRCHWVLAAIYRLSGNFKDAEQHYRRAIALNPNDAHAIAGLGRALAALGRCDEALDRVREAIRLNPYHPEWYWQVLGTVLFSAGRYAEAAEALSRMTRGGFWSRCYLAACLAQLDRIEEAAAAIDEARRLRPDCSLAKIRPRDISRDDRERFIEGLRRAGLPE